MAKGKTAKVGAAHGAGLAAAPAGDTAGPSTDKPAAGAPDKDGAPARPRSPTSWRTVAQFAKDEDLAETTVYAEMGSGRLKGVKIGRSTRITDEASDAWKAALPAYTPGGDAFNKRGKVAA